MFKMIFASVMTMVLSDGQHLETEISLSNPTRIIFEDDKPTKMIFNAAGENAPSIAAELGTSGDIFISVEQGLVGQSVSGFMLTESGKTYPVRFNIAAIDTSQVTVASADLRAKAKEAEVMKASSAPLSETPEFEWNTTNSYTSNLGNMIRALYYLRRPEGFEDAKASKLPRFGNEQFSAEPVKRFVSNDVEAVIYSVSATAGHSVYLPTQLDDLPRYLAMSYSSESIEPGTSGFLYVILKRQVK